MIVTNYVDAVIGLQYGDEGKGKIVAGINEQRNYSLTARYNGGPNAGHTIRIKGRAPLKLHQLPSSIAWKKEGLIGPGAVIDFVKLDAEVNHFEKVMGFNPLKYLTIDPMVPTIGNKHKIADKNYHAEKGSTSSGIAPAYADFYNRTAILAGSLSYPDNNGRETINTIKSVDTLLLEGAQGWYLSPYTDTYPYSTSSSSHPASAAMSMNFPAHKLRHIVGVAKCYETRSGVDPNFENVLFVNGYLPPQDIKGWDDKYYKAYSALQTAGGEVGVTTGRLRNIRYLDLSRLIKAIQESGTTIVVLNKWDILSEVHSETFEAANYFYNGRFVSCKTVEEMISHIKDIIGFRCSKVIHTFISRSPRNDIDWSILE